MAEKKKVVDQSRTMWVKKGTIVNGKKVEKGYVAQLGKPEKKVKADVKLAVDTKGRGKAGDVVSVNKDKKKAAGPAKPAAPKGNDKGKGTDKPKADAAKSKAVSRDRAASAKIATDAAKKKTAASSAAARKAERSDTKGSSKPSSSKGDGKAFYQGGGGGLVGKNSPLKDGIKISIPGNWKDSTSKKPIW